MKTHDIEHMKKLAEEHIAADAVVQGEYWVPTNSDVGGQGCFIGCLTRSSEASAVTEAFGINEGVVRVAEAIFENLDHEPAVDFFRAVPNAIDRDGKDLSRVVWLLLSDLLRHLPEQDAEDQNAIEAVIEVVDLLAAGRSIDASMGQMAYEIVSLAAYHAPLGLEPLALQVAERAAFAVWAKCCNVPKSKVGSAISDATHLAVVDAAKRGPGCVTPLPTSTGAEAARQRDVFLKLLREAE